MRFKLDENLDRRLVPSIEALGHEVDTVLDEALSGASDRRVLEECQRTGRALITLDLDFSNPLRFPPESTEGILVVRPTRPSGSAIRNALMAALSLLDSQPLTGRLWIAEPGRVRIYDSPESP